MNDAQAAARQQLIDVARVALNGGTSDNPEHWLPGATIAVDAVLADEFTDTLLAAKGIEVNADDEWRAIPTDLPANHNGQSIGLLCVFYVPNDDGELGGTDEDDMAGAFAHGIIDDINADRARNALLAAEESYRPWEVAGIPFPQFLTSAQLVTMVNRLRVGDTGV